MKRLVCWLSFSLSFIILGCSIPERPELVSISNPPVFRPKSPQQVNGLQDAMAAIITVCSQDLGLPVVEPFYLHLYKDANAYAAYTWGLARLPENIVRLTLALPQENRLHINMERTQGRTWGSLLRYLAHEYAHNVEYVVIGSLKPWNQWLREGFADWVATKVLDSLGWEQYSSVLARAQKELSRYGASTPRLSQLQEGKEWLSIIDQPKGKVRAYGLAFITVDKLIEKKGLAGIMNYFRSEDFSGSFGVTWGEFENEMKGLIKDLFEARPVGRISLKAEKRPEWKIGYQWRYALSAPGIKGVLTSEVVREESFDGVPTYVLRVGKNEYLHAKDDLSLLATLSEGRTVTKNTPPLQLAAWPLEVDKEWRNTILIENVERKTSQKIDMESMVATAEEIKVPAGTFEAFKFETYAYQTGELVSEQWYSPQVKWLVKSKTYRQEGAIEQELVSLKLD